MTLACRNNETPALQATQLNVKMTDVLSAVGICVEFVEGLKAMFKSI